MVEVDFSGNYLSADNCKPNDIGTFTDEGKYEEKSRNGKTWKQLSITVDINQKQYTHTFRSTEGKRFQDTFGKDTKTWIGKQFTVTFVPYVTDKKEIKQNVEIIPKLN
jgi:hypothetical protein